MPATQEYLICGPKWNIPHSWPALYIPYRKKTNVFSRFSQIQYIEHSRSGFMRAYISWILLFQSYIFRCNFSSLNFDKQITGWSPCPVNKNLFNSIHDPRDSIIGTCALMMPGFITGHWFRQSPDANYMIGKHTIWINGTPTRLPNRLCPRPSVALIMGLHGPMGTPMWAMTLHFMSTCQEGSDEHDLEWIDPVVPEF